MAIKQTKREINAEQNRHQIVQAATELFDEFGFDKVTMDDICEKANVSRSTFYSLFHSKQDLIMLYDGVERKRYLKAHYVYREDIPFRELLQSFWKANLAHNRHNGHLWSRSTYISYIETYRQESQENNYYQEELQRIIDRGIREHAFAIHFTSEEYRIVLHDWLIGVLLGWSLHPDDKKDIDDFYERILDQMVDIVTVSGK